MNGFIFKIRFLKILKLDIIAKMISLHIMRASLIVIEK